MLQIILKVPTVWGILYHPKEVKLLVFSPFLLGPGLFCRQPEGQVDNGTLAGAGVYVEAALYPLGPYIHVVYAMPALNILHVKAFAVVPQGKLEYVAHLYPDIQGHFGGLGVFESVIERFFKDHDEVEAHVHWHFVVLPAHISTKEYKVDIGILEELATEVAEAVEDLV